MRLTLFSRYAATAAIAISAAMFSMAGHAIPITFTYDSSASTATISNETNLCLGCSVNAVVNPDDVSFPLDGLGNSESFDFLTVSGSGFLGVYGADISATLAFSAPSDAEGTGSGSLGFATFFGAISGGSLIWNTQPGLISFDDGTEIDLAFSNLGGLCVGRCRELSGTVVATSTLTSNPVSEPGSLALLGFGAFLFAGRFATRKGDKSSAV